MAAKERTERKDLSTNPGSMRSLRSLAANLSVNKCMEQEQAEATEKRLGPETSALSASSCWNEDGVMVFIVVLRWWGKECGGGEPSCQFCYAPVGCRHEHIVDPYHD